MWYRGMLAIAVGLATLSAAGCGDDELTCAVLQDPTNCWAEAAAAAAACLPPPSEVGVLAPDRGSCSFSDGTLVVFDTPLPTDNFDLERFAFTVETNGSACARFVDTFQNRMELTAGGTTVVSELHAGSEFHLHCGDGTTYSSSFDLLFTCPAGSAPTDGFRVEQNLVEFFIVSVATSPDPLFTCAP